MTTVRWGILSTAKIGLNAVIPAMQRGRLCDMAAIASRDGAKAAEAARNAGIPRSYGSYEELLADKDIQAIYNPLPNHLHVPWTIKCLEAGKHVLCEKPIGVTLDETIQLLETMKRFPKLKVMEAFMYRFHPQWDLIRSHINKRTIGDISWMQSSFTYHNVNPDDIRNKLEYGGGGLLDIGCYCISVSRFLFGAEPKRVFGEIESDPETGVDLLTSGILDFGGRRATFTCSTRLQRFQRAELFGTEGKIEIDTPYNPPGDLRPLITIRKGTDRQELQAEAIDQYTLQGDAFSRAILNDTPVPTPIDDALANMKVIDGIFRSARGRQWIDL